MCDLLQAQLAAPHEAEQRGLSVSVYGRLVGQSVSPFFLDTQYRSHPKLAAFSAQTFYGKALKSGVTADLRPPPLGVRWPNPRVGICFLEIASQEEIEYESKLNRKEVERVLHLVLQVLLDRLVPL